jgi:phenylalanyl-tRNA synthetase beta chain
MKLTLSWLSEYLDTTATAEQIAEKLTAIGLEVESFTDQGKLLAPFKIAHVESAEQHPNADRLRVCKVNTGKEIIQVVCGAPNAKTGMKAVLALPGDFIPRDNYTLKKGNIRGQESQGMLCSASELGLGDDAAGIIELPADAPIGKSYAATYGLNDATIEINLTPNRADCAGIYGVARDLAAAGLGTLKPITAPKITEKFASPNNVTIDTPHCPQFALRVIRGVKNGPSPAWLQQKLRSVGLRPISALVDITNFFTIAHARPMHVFDTKKITGNLRVYDAVGGETIAALNDKTYTLPAGATIIADDSGPISVAGIVGGISTSVDENTTDVILEIALWNPEHIAKTGRAIECITDARYRFERGVDSEFVLPALDLATQMILDLCGGEASQKCVAGKTPAWQRTIAFDPARVKTLGGVDLPSDKIQTILRNLGFAANGAAWTPPSWRGDINGSADLVEEIIRIHGLDNVPAASLPMTQLPIGQALNAAQKRERIARRFLAARGMTENLSFAFTSYAQANLFGGGAAIDLRLINPISSDLDQLRPSVLPSLLTALQFNAARAMPDLALFEIGAQYMGVKPDDQKTVAAMIHSGASPRHWQQKSAAVDAYLAKGEVLVLLAEFGVDTGKLQITATAPAWYHPGQSGAIALGPNVLAYFGGLHPQILAHYDLKMPVVAAEVFLQNLPAAKTKASKARPLLVLPELNPLTRDFAFVVDDAVRAADVLRAAREADKTLIVDAAIFDVFTGGNLGAGKKSLAVQITLQPTAQTLTDAEIESLSQRVIANVQTACGAVLRG